MGRFGIGTRVRDDDGDTGVIVAKPEKGKREVKYEGNKGDRAWLNGETIWWRKSELTVIGDAVEADAAPAGELQIGDRVRFVEDYGSANVGDEGVISGFLGADGNPKGGVAVDANDRTYSCYASRVEKITTPAVAPATEWVPKVGDRVRVVKHCNRSGHKIPLHAPVGSEHEVTKICHHFDDEGVPTFLLSGGGHNFYMPVNVELLPALTIEAGKSYKTRDGRKVGPMRDTEIGDGFPWRACADEVDDFYSNAGVAQFYGNDLVAEWTDADEPVVTVEATPAEVTAKPKFKVGDKVRVVRSNYGCKQDHIGREFLIKSHCGELDEEYTWSGGSGSASNPYRWKESELELVVEPPKFKVGDRVTPKPEQLRKVVGYWEEHWMARQGRAHADLFYVVKNENDFLGICISASPQGDGPYWPAEFFNLVPEATPQVAPESFIVARLTPNGAPRPNARPRVHATLDSANQEAQRLADRLGDEFAVYQRVSSRTVDAGDVPEDFKPRLAAGWVDAGLGSHRVDEKYVGMAFSWGKTPQGFWFWANQREHLTPLGRAILRKWIAEAQSTTTTEAA